MKNIQLPDDIYQQAAQLAEQDHVSVDRFVAAVLNESARGWNRLKQRSERGSLERLREVLAKVSDTPPAEEDRL
ncbi:MAG: hypothetical protein ABR928_00940 [Terracidiphilus sp.]|jgi:hypothetical protein